MTPPTLTPAEQIARFIERHPGEWREVPSENPDELLFVFEVYPFRIKLEAYLSAVWGSLEHVDHHDTPSLDPCPVGASLLTQIEWRGADVLQAHGGTCDAMPPWLADPVRRILRTRAGELLTLAGSSPADVVSAAETLDEYLVSRGVVEVTGILPTLLEIGMSCRWATGYDESPDDYIALVSRRLAAVAGECETLRVTMKQAIAHLDAYDRSDGHEALAPINARAVLRRALGVV